MKKFITICCLILGIGSSSIAYDIDTHMYSTTLMLIFCGVKPEMAYKMAAAAQWIDESPITTPMFTERQRRLFHFPQELVDAEIPLPKGPELASFLQKIEGAENNTDIQKSIESGARDVVHGLEFNALGGVIRDNPFAYNLALYAAMRKSIWMMGGAIHVLHDSFGHRNYSAALGHANAGHDPDRPYLHWDNYKKMVHATTQMMVLVRRLLPPEALDPNFVLPGTNIKALEADADTIHKAFVENPIITGVLAKNILRSTEYTHYVISGVLYGLDKMGAIVDKNEIKRVLMNTEMFQQGKDSYEILAGLIESYIMMPEAQRAKIFDLNVVRKSITGSITLGRSIDQLIQSHGVVLSDDRRAVIKELSAEIAENILLTQVPKELTNERSFLVEKENIFRTYEMNMRLNGVKSLITHFTGKNVVFTAGNPKTIMKEIVESDDDLERVADTLKNTEFVTLTRSERLKWNLQMFRYYIVDLVVGLRLKNGWGQKFKILNWVGATPTAHTITDPRVLALLDEKEFNTAVSTGLLSKMLTPQQADKIISRHQELQTKLRGQGQQLIDAKKSALPTVSPLRLSCAKTHLN